jgi:hypothetical protein
MHDRDVFNTVFSLMARQPWLAEKNEALSNMLFEECKCIRTREMLIDVLSNFFYLSNQSYMQSLEALALEVIEEGNIETETQFVAMAGGADSDSSHSVLYGLKFFFAKHGWKLFKGVSSFGAAYKTYTRSGQKNIIVVDDFVGSGQTVIGRSAELFRVFKNAGVEDFKISFKVLVSTEFGLAAVKEAGIEVTTQHVIKKAIDDRYPEALASEYRDLMIAFESCLSKEFNGIEMPSLGYNGAQAAYCREQTNSPNSVFPVFWWPVSRSNEDRLTLLHRAMGDA